MPTIETLSKKKSFIYTGNCEEGFYLEYSGRPFVSSGLISQILRVFRGREVLGGFNKSNPSGFGLWLQQNTSFSSQHGSHIAAVMVHEALIGFRLKGSTVMLDFP